MPTPSHPMIPLLRVVNSIGLPCGTKTGDFDLVLSEDPTSWADTIARIVTNAASHTYKPKASENYDYQIARGPMGISM